MKLQIAKHEQNNNFVQCQNRGIGQIGFKIGFCDNAYKMRNIKGLRDLVSEMKISEKNFP